MPAHRSSLASRHATSPDVIVVGAGVAGLACATLLVDRGLRVLVVEAGETPGGRARSWADPVTGDTVDIGPHVLLNKYPNMLGWLGQLGTSEQIFWQTDELLTVLDQHRPIHFKVGGLPAPLHWLRNLTRILPSVPLHQLMSNTRLGWRTLRSTGDDLLQLDNRTGRDYLEKMGVSAEFIDWFWASAALAILNVPVEKCSAAALMRVFAQALGHNDIAFGIPRVGLSDLYAWPAMRYIEHRGGEVRLNCPAGSLVRQDGQVKGVKLIDGTMIAAPHVVLAVPPTAISALLPEAHPLTAIAQRFHPSPYISCYLWFDRRVTAAPFWARPWSSAEINTDFYDLSNVRSGGAGAGSMIATNIIWSERIAHLSDEEIIKATIEEIADFAPLASEAVRWLQASSTAFPCRFPVHCPASNNCGQRRG